jgi:hypothetical protein
VAAGFLLAGGAADLRAAGRGVADLRAGISVGKRGMAFAGKQMKSLPRRLLSLQSPPCPTHLRDSENQKRRSKNPRTTPPAVAKPRGFTPLAGRKSGCGQRMAGTSATSSWRS